MRPAPQPPTRPTAGWQPGQLAYCSNVHPAPTLEALERVVSGHLAAVRRERRLQAMGAGLWIGAAAARALQEPGRTRAFGHLLEREGIRLFTLNGFPYDDFHTERVKERVYRPDWSDPRRLAYTLNLARILADNLPGDEPEGTISTLPLGYAPGWGPQRQQEALTALCRLVRELGELHRERGRRIRVCLEMEPGCVLERSDQIIDLFTRELPAEARRQGLSPELLRRHLGVCYDVCHQAVMFEDPAESIPLMLDAGIRIGKIQLSSALQLDRPAAGEQMALLTEFVEPRYLHQVRTRDRTGGTLSGVMDLPEALADPCPLPLDGPWRIHFHLPIQLAHPDRAGLSTTREAITGVLEQLRLNPGLRPHLEVETYTWQVLPPALRPADDAALHRGLARELAWLEAEMNEQGLIGGEYCGG